MAEIIKWVKPEKLLGKAITSMIDPEEMLRDFLRVGLIDRITGNYSADVWDMCRNGATWLGCKLYHLIGDEVSIIEGKFEGGSQCFVCIGDYYLDMTISMWVKDAPKFAAVKIKDAHGYFEFMRFSIPKWLEYCGFKEIAERECQGAG